MRRREIQRKFDEIVDFAEIERFVDTSVKRYSSGMYVRLAFAVAAHLDPEILVIDEVLAVGDAQFQKKCLGKMGDVARGGRTVLFVSHQLPAVRSLCSRAIQMSRGAGVRDGDPKAVVNRYLATQSSELSAQRVWSDAADRPGNSEFRLVAIRVLDATGQVGGPYPSRRPVTVEIEFDLSALDGNLCVGFDLVNRDGVTVLRSHHNDRSEHE